MKAITLFASLLLMGNAMAQKKQGKPGSNHPANTCQTNSRLEQG